MPNNFILPREKESMKKTVVKTYRDGADYSVPIVDMSGTALMLTNALLAANGTYIQVSQDRFAEIVVSRAKGYVFASHAGTLTLEESNDGTTWTATTNYTVTENSMLDTGWIDLTKRFFRFKYVNGGTAQTSFALHQALAAGSNDLQLSGSKVVEQKTEDDAVTDTVVFFANINTLEIYNTDATNAGVFNVNGINITVPAEKSFKASFGGTPSANVTITGSTSYILTRYE